MKRDKATRKLFRAKVRSKLKQGTKNVLSLAIGAGLDVLPIPTKTLQALPINLPQADISPVAGDFLNTAMPLLRTVKSVIQLIKQLRDAITELLEDLGINIV